MRSATATSKDSSPKATAVQRNDAVGHRLAPDQRRINVGAARRHWTPAAHIEDGGRVWTAFACLRRGRLLLLFLLLLCGLRSRLCSLILGLTRGRLGLPGLGLSLHLLLTRLGFRLLPCLRLRLHLLLTRLGFSLALSRHLLLTRLGLGLHLRLPLGLHL